MPSKHKSSWRERCKSKATPAELKEILAKEAGKRRRARTRKYFAREYGRVPSGPDDERDVRRMMRGHPAGCPCFDCLFEPEVREEFKPRVCGAHYDR